MKDWVINEDYVRKLTLGDPEVEKHFVSHFGTLMRIKLKSKLRSPQLIDDIRQETFFRVLRTLRTPNGLHNPERLGSFINSVCNNVMLEFLRTSTRHRPIPEDAPDPPDEAPNPSKGVENEERGEMVRRLLAELPAKDRELLRNLYFLELDKTAICEKMHVTPEYLRVLAHRAKGRFRDLLEKGERPPS